MRLFGGFGEEIIFEFAVSYLKYSRFLAGSWVTFPRKALIEYKSFIEQKLKPARTCHGCYGSSVMSFCFITIFFTFELFYTFYFFTHFACTVILHFQLRHVLLRLIFLPTYTYFPKSPT